MFLKNNYKHFSQVNGNGHATLIKNWNNSQISTGNPYRIVGTIMTKSSSFAYDILPVNFKNDYLTFNSENNDHVIRKRTLLEGDLANENQLNSKIQRLRKFPRKKRSLIGNPITAYVELLIVTDTSVLNNFKIQTSTSDLNIIFSNMRVYYANAIHSVRFNSLMYIRRKFSTLFLFLKLKVNERYINSLKNDSDLRINIVPKNFLFLTVRMLGCFFNLFSI